MDICNKKNNKNKILSKNHWITKVWAWDDLRSSVNRLKQINIKSYIYYTYNKSKNKYVLKGFQKLKQKNTKSQGSIINKELQMIWINWKLNN